MHITIATRQSPLALWQANHIKHQLQSRDPKCRVDLLAVVTRGDKILDTPLAKIGGKGLFVKELEQALLDKRATIAVHSLKDVPMELPKGLTLGAYCARHKPTDAFVSNRFASLEDLPCGATVGTSSLRRQCQLLAHRPDLTIRSLRGNVGTRLAKLDAGEYDAIVLATSGLERLGLFDRARPIATETLLPAVGQGALAIECRDDPEILAYLADLDDEDSRYCSLAERALNHSLQGGCQVPIAGFAVRDGQTLSLQGRVGTPDGKTLLKARAACVLSDDRVAAAAQAQQLGKDVAATLLEQGAQPILQALYDAQ